VRSFNPLPYARQPDYLSPSALKQLENDPAGFYLQRLAPDEFKQPREPQGFPAARGEAFDASTKAMLEGTEPDFSGIDKSDRRDEAIAAGLAGRDAYVKCGAYGLLKADPLANGRSVVSVRSDIRGFIPGTEVPLRGKVDLAHAQDGKLQPLDWKTTGNPSPNKGFVRHWGTTPGGKEVKSPHKDWGLPMEAINPAWADQLAVYHWLLGNGIEAAAVGIDLVCYQADGSVRIAQYRATVSAEWQLALRGRMVKAWDQIHEGTVVPQELASAGIEFLLSLPGSTWW
jgi:hypothetical protein